MNGTRGGGNGATYARGSKPGPRQFLVRLMRPIFQTAVVSIEATTDAEAATLALRGASGMGERGWTGEYDASSYALDVQEIVDVDEAEQAAGDANSGTLLSPAGDYRYLILKADVALGQGELLMEPWLEAQSVLMVADLTGDWLTDLDSMRNSHV